MSAGYDLLYRLGKDYEKPEFGIKTVDVDGVGVAIHERVEIDKLEGRIAATMLVPYPPGIPTIMPGERFGARDSAILESLRIARAQNRQFPGFESDIHGLIAETTPAGMRYLVEVLKQ